MSQRLHDNVAIVTGAGSGIGLAIAERFASEGAQVVGIEIDPERARRAEEAIASQGGRVSFEIADVSDHGGMKNLVTAAVQRYGRLDVLVNNAGIGLVGNLEQTSEEDFDRLYRVNVKGVFNGMAAAVGHFLPQGRGVILNMASIASKVGIHDRFAYGMTKGAVLTMTLSVARDYVDKGIRCNCICPARIHTPFVDKFVRENYPGREAEVLSHLSAYQPIGRMGRPEEVASLALFLCSEEAAFITGACYDIDGGVTLLR